MAFEQKILNDVWDEAAHALRSSAGVAANPQTTLSYNAAGDLIKIEELENGITTTQTLSNSDMVVASTKVISPRTTV